jgi:hypothetical protein
VAKDRELRTDADDADVVWVCARKSAYAFQSTARAAAARVRAASPYSDVREYACRRCGQWHIGGHSSERVAAPLADDVAEMAPPQRGHRPRRYRY